MICPQSYTYCYVIRQCQHKQVLTAGKEPRSPLTQYFITRKCFWPDLAPKGTNTLWCLQVIEIVQHFWQIGLLPLYYSSRIRLWSYDQCLLFSDDIIGRRCFAGTTMWVVLLGGVISSVLFLDFISFEWYLCCVAPFWSLGSCCCVTWVSQKQALW